MGNCTMMAGCEAKFHQESCPEAAVCRNPRCTLPKEHVREGVMCVNSDRGEFGMPGLGTKMVPPGLLPQDLVTHTPEVKWSLAPSELRVDFGNEGYTVGAETDMARRILERHVPAAIEHFLKRNAEYGDDNDFNLGVRGQYVDISRKVQKLKRRWWDGEDVPDGAESDKVVVMELIGHLLMAMDMLAEESDGKSEG